METNTCSADGELTDVQLAHYEARAKGGAGMLIQEFTAVDGGHTVRPLQLRIDDDKFKVRLSRLVDAVHAYGTPIICQLHHAGMFLHRTRYLLPASPAMNWGRGIISSPGS